MEASASAGETVQTGEHGLKAEGISFFAPAAPLIGLAPAIGALRLDPYTREPFFKRLLEEPAPAIAGGAR